MTGKKNSKLAAILIAMVLTTPTYPESHRIEVDGAILHVETNGPKAAPAILMWNGAACTTHMWDKVVPQLSDRFFAIQFDVRGTGQSSPAKSDDQYTFETYSPDAIAILRHFGYEKSIVWSMAWGSRVAVAYAGLHPERVQLLALYDASVGRADVPAQGVGREKAFKAQQEAGIPLIDRPEDWNTHLDQDEMRKALGAARTFGDLSSLLPKITAPTLVCTGDYDPNLDSSKKIANEIPNARLEIMKNVGHGSVLQRPDLTTEIFLRFVDEHTDAVQ